MKSPEIRRTLLLQTPATLVLFLFLTLGRGMAGEKIAPLDPQKVKPLGLLGDTRFRHADAITCIVPIQNGTRLLTSSRDGTARLWDAQTGAEIRRFTHAKDDVWSVAALPGEHRMLTGGEEKSVSLWDLNSGVRLKRFEGHEGYVFRVAVLPQTQQIVSTSKDKSLRLWNITSGETEKTFKGHTSDVYGVAATPDGKTIVSASSDNSVRVWDVASGQERMKLAGHAKSAHTVIVTADGKRAISCGSDKTVKAWDLSDGKEVWNYDAGNDVNVVALSPDGKSIAATAETTMRVLNVEDGKERLKISVNADYNWPVAFSFDGKEVFSGGDNLIYKWNAQTGARLFPAPDDSNHRGGVRCLALLKDGKLLSAGQDGKLHVWSRAGTDAEHLENWMADKSIYALAVSPDGKLAAAGGDAKQIWIWSTHDGKLVREIVSESTVYGLCFAAGGRRIIGVGSNRRGAIWDAASGEKLCTIEGHTDDLNGVDVSPDGLLAAVASRDHTIGIIDVMTGKPIATLEAGEKEVECCAISADGRSLLAGGSDQMLRLWRVDAVTGAGGADAEEIKRLIVKLSSDEFQERQAAVAALAAMGKAASAALAKLDTSRDLDLALRVRQVNERMAAANVPARPAASTPDLGGSIRSLAIHPDNLHWAAVVSVEPVREIVLGKFTETGVEIVRRISDPHYPRSVLFSPDGKKLLVANSDSTISIFGCE
ncbi:MAG TPA: PQQ-binding-like beta-propeller repeat protein [Planctomycetota bacterium]|nr:PQQ-binding-like beta-propeller repeat protein [Planctomycetota bacterium]